MFKSDSARLRWRPLLGPLALALFTGVLVGCAGSGTQDEQRTTAHPAGHYVADGLPTVAMPAFWAWGEAENLGTLTRSADVVFRGTVVALRGQRPVSSSVGTEPGVSTPHFASLPVSGFEVRVESALSGNLAPGTDVTFEQLGGLETQSDGTQVRIMLKGDAPIEVGATYLFFGTFQADGSIVAPPFGRMKVGPEGSLDAEAGWGHLGALAELSRGNLGDAERQISAAAAGE
jgi:hypothetical protein